MRNLYYLAWLLVLLTSYPAAAQGPPETPVPTITPSPTATIGDAYEPNDEPAAATPLNLNEPLDSLTLAPAGDVDYFRLYLKAGQLARAATFPEGATDTRLAVYSESGALLGENDDRSGDDLGSTVVWMSPADGWYLLRVESATPLGGGYQLLASLELPTATPSPLPTGTPSPTQTPPSTATPYTAADAGEPNNRPEDAYPILPDIAYGMTLGPAGVDDHDFYILLGKAGVTYRCVAADPEGVDPALRAYAGAIGSGVLLAENDDLSPADVGSAVTFTAVTDAPLYLVVEARAGYGRYTFRCDGGVGGGGANGGSPVTPLLTPPAVGLRIEVFVDQNGDETMGPGEGLDALLALVTPLDRAWTLARPVVAGAVILSPDDLHGVTAVIVSLPYLSYSQAVTLAETDAISVPLPAPSLPVMLP